MDDSNASMQLRSIKQRKQSHARLRQQFAEYDMLMESTGVCIVKARMEPGFPIEWCNEAACRAIGYTKEEYEAQFGRELRSYFRGREELSAVLKKELEAALQGGRQNFQALAKLPCRKGFFWAQFTGTFTDYDRQTGRPACVCGVFTDVTSVVEAQEKLNRADMENARLASILDNIPAGVSIYTIEKGAVTSITVNRHLASQLGVASGKTDISSIEQLLSYVHAEDRGWCRKALNDFLHGKARFDIICRLRLDGIGSFSWMHVEGRLVKQSEDLSIVYLTYTDVTALKETGKTLSSAVVAAKLVVWEYDIRTHTIYMADNETTDEHCLKYEFGRVITGVPEALAEIVDEHSMPAVLEMYKRVEAGENASCDLWFKRKPGLEPHCEHVSYTVEMDEQGLPARAYAVSVNITAEKSAEERYSRERSFLQDNRDFNLISKGHYNLTQNKVLEYTMQADKTPGGNYFDTHSDITYDEAAAALFRMPCSEEDHASLVDAVDRQKLLQRYQEGHLTSRAQYRRLRKGDLPLWMSVEMRTYASPLTGDVECFSYTYDITDKVRNEQIMNHIAATEFDYVALIFEKDGMFEFLQKSDRILFPGLHVRTLYADCCSYVRRNFVSEGELPQYDYAVSLANIIAGLNANGRWSSTYRRTENGRIFCKQTDYSWLDKEERVIIAVRTDISASYERDQQQLSQMRAAKLEADRANEAKSSFLSSMSHDMRTPLNAVLGFTNLALREQDAAVKQDYMNKVKSSGELLLDLVNDTLEMSRIESGKFVLESEAVNWFEVWDSVITSLRPSAELKNITLAVKKPDDLHETIWTDRLKLQKILLNLISNAIKYTQTGGRVSVESEKLDCSDGGCKRRIIVEDNGIGISPDFLPEVFEPFTQERRAETQNVFGTGLGLAIVKRIVTLMGGTISVQSKLHCGTRFTVELPILTAEHTGESQRSEPESLVSLAGKKVLLCEDNDLNAEIVTILLKEQGVEVDRAKDGEAGARLFSASLNGYYDVVLMDIRMPVLDGYGATAKIRALPRPDAKTVPIVAMTADAFDEDARRAREAGMDGYISKPVDPQKLFRTLVKARHSKTAV